VNVIFERQYDWAFLPIKKKADEVDSSIKELYEDNFRWLRQNRKKEYCAPWRVGNELGWYVCSPIDVTIYPLDDFEMSLDPNEMENIHKVLGFKNLWKRENSYISLKDDWLKLYQFKGKTGSWDTMFIPNGEGTVEWRLGFSIVIPNEYSLLICPLEENKGYSIPYGVLTSKQLSSMNSNGGVSIAIKPQKILKICRGEPIGRIILISTNSIKASHEYK